MGRTKEAAAEALTAVEKAVSAGDVTAAPSGRAGSVETRTPSPRQSRLPGPARFTLAVVLSFAISSLGRSFVNYSTQNEISSVAREPDSQTELIALTAWKLYVSAGAQSSNSVFFRSPFQLRAEEADPFSSTKLTRTGMADSG